MQDTSSPALSASAPISLRSRYRTDGNLLWSRLPLACIVALAAAAIVGLLFHLAYSMGFYLFLVFPILGGCAVGFVVGATLGWARCRNAWLAAAVGLVAGMAAYACYFECGLLSVLPANARWRFDLLPRYVWHRLQTDVILSTHDVGRQGKRPSPVENCIFFGLDLVFLLSMSTSIAWKRARRAYCPELDEWMRQETTRWLPRSGPSFLAALEGGKLAEFVANAPAGGNPRACCRLTVEYAAPAGESPLKYPVYATITDVPLKSAMFRPDWIPTTLLRQVALEPAEVLALRPVCAEMAKLLAIAHPELAEIPADVTPGVDAAPAGGVAQLSRIPSAEPKRTGNNREVAWLVFLRLAPGLAALAAALIFGGGVYLAVAMRFESAFFVTTPLAVGLLLFAIYAGLLCKGVLEGRWQLRRLRAAIAGRRDALVTAADAQAVCVSLIPRAAFDAVWGEMPDDVLLLKIDAPEKRLLAEGRENRFCIPAGAIRECQTQYFYHKLDQKNASPRWMVRLVVGSVHGLRELLLRIDHVRWVPTTNGRRRRAAEDLVRRISALCSIASQ